MQWFPDYSILANLLMRVSDPQTGTNHLGNILWQPIADVSRFIQIFYMPKTLYVRKLAWRIPAVQRRRFQPECGRHDRMATHGPAMSVRTEVEKG
jgi:hypothetical protein